MPPPVPRGPLHGTATDHGGDVAGAPSPVGTDPRAGDPDGTDRGRPGSRRTWVAVVALVIAGVLVVTLAGRYDLTRVRSASMAPTFGSGDLLLVDTRAYDGARPQQGDVIVFTDPGGWADDAMSDGTAGALFLKRVIGVGGDEVYCCDADQRLLVNGEIVDEHYLPSDAGGQGLRSVAHIPDGRLWVLGDNRRGSIDSRHRLGTSSLGYVPETDVVGRVVLTIPAPGPAQP